MNTILNDLNSIENDLNTTVLGDLIPYALSELERKKHSQGLSGTPSGFSNLDRITSGWQQSQLIVLASRPSMGKTSFILSALRNSAIDFGIPVAIFSLEMTSTQLVNRLISAESEIDVKKIQNGQLAPYEWTQLHHKIQRLNEAPIFIDDIVSLTFEQLRDKCIQLVEEHGVKVVAIDYLQLMLSTNDKDSTGEYEELSRLIRGLKKLSKELNITIIALSQLNRAVETRVGNKKPSLIDLRGSGAIEDDSDMILFLYRPEYYNITQDEEGNSTVGIGEVIIAKNRSGSLDTVQLRFASKFTKFYDLDSCFEPVATQGFSPEINGLSSFGESPSGDNIFRAKANDLSNFGSADPSKETPF